MNAPVYFFHFIILCVRLHASVADAGNARTSYTAFINPRTEHQHGSNYEWSSSMQIKAQTKRRLQSSPLSFSPFLKNNQPKTSCLRAGGGGFFDDLMNGTLFNSNNKDSDKDEYGGNDSNKSKQEVMKGNTQYKEENDDENTDEFSWNEGDFQKEIQKRNQNPKVTAAATATVIGGGDDDDNSKSYANINNDGGNGRKQVEEENEYDGYALRDAIYAKWGKCYDIDFQPVQSFGFRELYVNVLPFHLGGRRFRHETELDYLCHLQAVVEILIKYEQLDYVLLQLEETKKVPRAGTSPLVAVPFRLDLTEDELNSILS